MTPGQAVGLVLMLAMATVYMFVLAPLLPAVRAYLRLRREWAALNAQVNAARADIDACRAAERESLIDRIARDEMAGFFAAWSERVER